MSNSPASYIRPAKRPQLRESSADAADRRVSAPFRCNAAIRTADLTGDRKQGEGEALPLFAVRLRAQCQASMMEFRVALARMAAATLAGSVW